MLSIAFIGRPNVGKSTLFNKLLGKKLAIVDDTPGVTRDWREAEGYVLGHKMRLIDTAGLEDTLDDSMEGRMRKQTEMALSRADVAVFMIDGRAGITPLDKYFAGWLRKQKIPVVTVVNKCEGKAGDDGFYEAFGLGLGGDPIAISAEHSEGLGALEEALVPFMQDDIDSSNNDIDKTVSFDLDAIEGSEDFDFATLDDPEEEEDDKPIKMAIVGRPNVGKSTLVNALLGEHRVMTGPEAGVTRDSIAVEWGYGDHKFQLVDTAGMRKKAKVQNKIEKMSVDDSMRAIRLAQIVILVLDADAILDRQDLYIAHHVLEEGRALVIAINKWDAVKDRQDALETLSYKLDTSLAQVKQIETVTISALKNRNLDRLMDSVIRTYDLWNKRLSTGKLNRWLQAMEESHPAPLTQGRPNRLRYITQIKTRPPTFAMWVSRPKDIPESYKRYIVNGLREDYDLPSVPIRLNLRTSKNPYAENR